MRRIVLTFGLIAGAGLSGVMLLTLPFHDQIGWDNGLLVGYTSMIVSFLLIYFGVRSYRDNVAGGSVGFGRAFAVGLLIGAVASACYAATWEAYYFSGHGQEFLTKYQAHELEKERAHGASPEAIAKKQAEMESFARMYSKPAINFALTFCEPFPVALVMSLVSAGVLSRRRRTAPAAPRTVVPDPGTPAVH